MLQRSPPLHQHCSSCRDCSFADADSQASQQINPSQARSTPGRSLSQMSNSQSQSVRTPYLGSPILSLVGVQHVLQSLHRASFSFSRCHVSFFLFVLAQNNVVLRTIDCSCLHVPVLRSPSFASFLFAHGSLSRVTCYMFSKSTTFFTSGISFWSPL